MRLSRAVVQLKDEWIAFRISRDGEDPEGEVILHEPNRAKFRERLHREKIRGVYITYAGDILPEGYAALFPCAYR